jgi:hypothetical protein
VPPPLVMPAIEPGWDDFLAGATAFTDAGAVCHAVLAADVTDAGAFAFPRVSVRARRPRTGVHPSTRAP